MFSIYGASGPVFRGALEELKRVSQLHSLRAARPIAQEGDEPGVEAMASQPRAEAIRAYREMIHHDQERGPLYHADQVMQRQVITVAAGDDVAQAWRTLRDHRIHQAPVLDDAARLIGIVSERDLLTAINIDAGRIVESLSRRVRDVMTTPVVAAAPVTDIRRIAAVMLDHDVDGVPITNDSGRLIGFLSRSDILRAVVTDPPLSLWR
ncbi:MAG: CBS domain-containing protein [Rhodocyclaceae bacterium]|nr:CBS domain-containing protein [Rhodocyclaceae bacterium]